MMKRKLLFVSLFIFGFVYSQHKFLNVPKLSDDDLKSTKCEKQEDAPAEILYRSIHYRIDYNGYMYRDIISRVKIYNKDNAGKFLSHEIPVFDSGKTARETLSDLKAYTYNYENGKNVAVKVERDEKYKSKEDKDYTITKFAFPNVKNGSVVEYSYTVLTPFLGSTPKIIIEQEIPTRYVEFVFDTPKPLGYNINYKGEAAPTYRDVEEKMLYGGHYQVFRFGYDNLPAYKEEKYVMNNDDYKTSIRAELNSTYINGQFKLYSLSWEDIRERLYHNADFGEQLQRQSWVKDILPDEIKNEVSKNEQTKAILKFVQNNYTWNKENNVFTDKGIKNLLSTKIGNTAEINLLLTMLLRSVGVDANPVVLSTVKRGALLSYTPSISQLNYVVASFELNSNLYLLDATSRQSEINMLPPRALNYYGFMMTKKEAKQINIVYPDLSKTLLTVDAKMNPDGTFEGHFSDKDTNLYAMVVNEAYQEDKTAYSKSYKDRYTFPFTELKHNIEGNNAFETSFDFSADTFADAIGNKLVFNPLLFLYSQNHDFNQKDPRKAPLEFYSANERVKKVTITLPDNYVFENIPKSKKFRTEDNALQYTYFIEQVGNNKLTIETSILIGDSVFPKEYYPAFTQIFNNITKQESQVVTAVKK